MNEQLLARHWNEIDELLDSVLEMAQPAREKYLARKCADRPELRELVEQLLSADRDSSRFLSGGYVLADSGDDAAPPAPTAYPPGTTVGPYRLERLLGEGGMGAVYLARRADGQFEQELAIKILHGGVLGTRGNERFVRERQILARLNHRHIARLLDGGVTDDGRPFFAMEYIDGDTIDAHCDRQRLPLRRRLELFLQICEAVQYAHGRFIVHRDLKPGNILVDHRDAVKLLDFGIATPFADGDGDATRTQMVMTPAYAAPEQFRGERATAQTDVYALGLVLYELLSGHRAHRVDERSPFELQRAVLETDPDRPSRVVTTESTDGKTSPSAIADARSTAPAALSRRLMGDLDAIVMKALRKEPDTRYASVEAMSRDVEAYLDNRPVGARRGTAIYRFRKVLRRHRVEAASAVAVLLALTGGVVAASTQARFAAADRDRATEAQAREAAINDFLLNELLRSPSPEFTKGEDVSVMQVLDLASKNVGHALREQPEVEASVRETLAQTYASLGRFDEAGAHAEAARARIAASPDVDETALLRARTLIAEVAFKKGEYQQCEQDVEQILDEQELLLGGDHEDTIRTALLRARIDQAFQRHDIARQRLQEEILKLEVHHPERWRVLAEAKSMLAGSMTTQRDVVAAEKLIRELLALRRDKLGPDHPDVGASLESLGQVLQRQLRYAEADEAFRELVELRRRTHGPRHPETADAINNVAVIAERTNRYEDTETLAKEVHGIYRETLGRSHPKTVHAVSNLGILYFQQGRLEEALPYYRETVELEREIYGEDQLRSIGHVADFGSLLHTTGRREEAEIQARRVIEGLERLSSKRDVDSEVLRRFAGYLLDVVPAHLRDPQRALTLAQEAVRATNGQRLDPLRVMAWAQRETDDLRGAIDTLYGALETDEAKDSWVIEAMLRNYLVAAGRFDEAETFLLENLARRRGLRDPDDWLTGRTLVHLAEFHRDRGRHEDAETRFRAALEQLRRSLSDADWRIGRALGGVGRGALERGAFAEAETLLLEAYETLEVDNGVRKEHLDRVQADLVGLYENTGRADEAERWRRKEHKNYHPE